MSLIKEWLNKQTRDALEAAETLKAYCKSMSCQDCIFHASNDDDCLLTSLELNEDYIERGELSSPGGWLLDQIEE